MTLAAGTRLGPYEIFSPIGRGGMGEVYKAKDTRLDRTVAIKVLRSDLSSDTDLRGRFEREARAASALNHPNITTVYDIGQDKGTRYIVMEFVEGKTLRELVGNGPLSTKQMLALAIQIVDGLAKAHKAGIVHRDLKPENLMVNDDGLVKIVDFGLAKLMPQRADVDFENDTMTKATQQGVILGTVPYMSPQQAAGRPVDYRSDQFSFGSILYEMATGRRAFKKDTTAQTLAAIIDDEPEPVRKLNDKIPAELAAIVERCLAKDPEKRYESTTDLATELRKNLLARTLAIGETPSPRLVADAGETTGLTTPIAWVCLVSILVGFVAITSLSGRTQLSQITPLPKNRELLSERCREILRALGYNESPRDTSSGFSYESAYVRYLSDQHPSRDRSVLATSRPSAVRFWYRQSPRYLVPYRIVPVDRIDVGKVSYADPPSTIPGMARVEVDPLGRLRQFDSVPSAVGEAGSVTSSPDWSILFSEAGLDISTFASVEPRWRPPTYADELAAWTGFYPEATAIPVRVEAAALAGRPVAFRIFEPWAMPSSGHSLGSAFRHWGYYLFVIGWSAITLIGAAATARRNLRLGRVDRKSTFRLAFFVLTVTMLEWLFGAHLVPDVNIVYGSVYPAFVMFGMVWVYYAALEPYVRRLYPEMLVSWIRLLDGRLRDPGVGRDVLVGVFIGVVGATLFRLCQLRTGWGDLLAKGQYNRVTSELQSLLSASAALSQACFWLIFALYAALFIVVSLILLRFILRRTWLALGALGLLQFGIATGSTADPWLLSWVALWITAMLAMLFRFGLLSIAAAYFVQFILTAFPLTFDLTAWYAGATIVALCLTLTLSGCGFWVSLGGRSAFKDLLVEP